jgi:hypothetical protein
MGSTRLHAAARDHMLDAYLYSDTDQHTAAGKPRFFVEHVSRFFTDIHCGQADESRRYADCQGGQLYIRVDHGKPDTDGKRIDTGCHPLYKEQRQRQIPSVYGFFLNSYEACHFRTASKIILPPSAQSSASTIQ